MHALWLNERHVCMRVRKHSCDIKMFCFACTHHTSTKLIKVLNWKLNNFSLFYQSTNSLQTIMLCQFFRLSWQFKREKKSSLWKASFLENKNWSCVQNFVYNTLQLVGISLLVSTMNNNFSFSSSGKLFYKSNSKLFTCVCIACYIHTRDWENTRQLYNCLKFSQPLPCLYQAV